MNKWKTAFWICLTFLIIATCSLMYAVYAVIDQSVTLMYLNDDYDRADADLETIIHIVNKTDMDKAEIEAELKTHPYFEYMDFATDTIELKRTVLIFENDTLKTMKNRW
ncbi:uncharacterized protein YpmS [Dysgonomonas sp. PFB1-18]|uniref:hypothetical protein n=1 Tax=unclassified Dysgonomonas TaxID=2630389 RepID=UPI00247646B1|nr:MULTISPECIES: hypothetical protein [unclassified Dysgonomonas]MDH6308245.1 uncharacterized protein YpmS [Dysgonomonas sp. PF1-14]MDH6338316.1 uncharacterized protein YpmS [Dysgonomonas sp. PF1-16]MDH6379813.1 uncharacterized protein YpmS [Dysgonomonas sp. PFB1-18]MDH6397097.1 uncharacterized protein YpmS [Dysgonomonas sp. PF1-23]